jgi:hypothetical protein
LIGTAVDHVQAVLAPYLYTQTVAISTEAWLSHAPTQWWRDLTCMAPVRSSGRGSPATISCSLGASLRISFATAPPCVTQRGRKGMAIQSTQLLLIVRFFGN